MRIGIMHRVAAERTLEDQVEEVVGEEADGFDSSWFGQVFTGDAMTLIALAAQRTSRIEMGTSVVPTYARHPFVMAQQALTVHAATGGRFALGIGPSHQVVIETLWGMSYERPARHVREYLSVLLPLIREGKVSFQGEVYRTQAELEFPPAPQMPVLIAALAPAMLKLAGAVADGTITWMAGTKAVATHIAPSINAAAAHAGRAAPRVVVGLPICVTDDAAGVRETAGKALAMYGMLPNYRRVLDIGGAAGPAEVTIAGDETQVERELRDVASAGATDFMAAVVPDASGRASIARTRALLKSLVGEV